MTRFSTNLIWLKDGDPPEAFPDVVQAMREPPGLLAAGGDLRSERLLAGYRRGIFPWFSPGQPILWWSPDPRGVLFPHEFITSRSLAKSVRRRGFELRIDSDFAAVIAACGARRTRPEGSWITAEMRHAYQQLHQQGWAHSVETWLDNRLVGGVYGVRLGRVFFGESMFSWVSDASKFALKALCTPVAEMSLPAALSELALIDCQMTTPHLCSLGVREIPRRQFLSLLQQYL